LLLFFTNIMSENQRLKIKIVESPFCGDDFLNFAL